MSCFELTSQTRVDRKKIKKNHKANIFFKKLILNNKK
jgi:hypothetical protein